MAKQHVMFEVVHDVPGYPFDPFGFQFSSLREAQRDLKRIRQRYPEAYLAQVEYTRYEKSRTKKGR